jgi:hypothetical protein
VVAAGIENAAGADSRSHAVNSPPAVHGSADVLPPYFLRYIQALSTKRTMVTIQSDESLIPVFLAMTDILTSNRNFATR